MRTRIVALAIVAAIACSKEEPAVAHTSGGDVALAPTGVAPAYRLVVDTANSEVRYRVRERLVGKELDNDAIGVTHAVSGEIAVNADGTVIPDASKITIDVTGLKSDQQRRDRYVQSRLLETAQYPTVVFQPTALRGAPKTLPASGSTAFSIIGNLTVRGVTHPTTWAVEAKFAPGTVTGTAATAFTFADFQINQPKVPILLSVADTIRLEYDFNFAVRK
jgi:polyisoprenoid-binding protein YceI